MSVKWRDTSGDARAVQLTLLREFGPERRSQLAVNWSDAIRNIAMHGIRARNGTYDDRRVVLEYARITLSECLFQDAFGAELAELE